MSDLAQYIRNVPDFPKVGIGFKDITTLLKDGEAFQRSIDEITARFDRDQIDKIVGIESRGFIFGAAIAHKWQLGFVPIRKAGKLPAETIREEYELEYGTDSLEIHRDSITAGERVLIIDDLLATGGTAAASIRLVEQLQGKIAGVVFLIELSFLNGREKLAGHEVTSIIRFDGE